MPTEIPCKLNTKNSGLGLGFVEPEIKQVEERNQSSHISSYAYETDWKALNHVHSPAKSIGNEEVGAHSDLNNYLVEDF